MDKVLAQRLKAYIETHPFDSGDGDYETVLDQLYQAYAESHESDPPEIGEGFKELEEYKVTSFLIIQNRFIDRDLHRKVIICIGNCNMNSP